MARFDKLEFGSSKEPEKDASDRLERDSDYWMHKADNDRRAGLYEGALKYYWRALELDKTLTAGWLGQVQMLVFLAETKEAELWASKALEMFPKNGDLLAARAHALCRLRDFKRAFAISDAALRESGQSSYRWLVRGEIMVARREDMDRNCFDKAQLADPDWLVPLEIAQVYLHYNSPTKGLPRARCAVEMATDEHYTWYVQGLCEAALGLNSAAEKSFRHCLQLSPRHVLAKDKLHTLATEWFGKRLWRRWFG